MKVNWLVVDTGLWVYIINWVFGEFIIFIGIVEFFNRETDLLYNPFPVMHARSIIYLFDLIILSN